MNLLADLTNRFYMEQDALIGWMKSCDVRSDDSKVVMAIINNECARVDAEQDFRIAAMSTGLLERVIDSLQTRYVPGDMEKG